MVFFFRWHGHFLLFTHISCSSNVKITTDIWRMITTLPFYGAWWLCLYKSCAHKNGTLVRTTNGMSLIKTHFTMYNSYDFSFVHFLLFYRIFSSPIVLCTCLYLFLSSIARSAYDFFNHLWENMLIKSKQKKWKKKLMYWISSK